MIAGTGYIKSANDKSLSRDEGGGPNLFMEVASVTYKTVQGRHLRMTPATATFFPVHGCSCAQGQASSEGKHVQAYDIQAAIVPRTTYVSDQQT